MNITKALQTYQSNSTAFNERFNDIATQVEGQFSKKEIRFMDILEDSLSEVNKLQATKNQAIEDFSSGKNDNVHDLMIAMQRASTAVQLTTAVRNKVLEIYKELSQMQL